MSKKSSAPLLAAAGLLSGMVFSAPAQALSTAEFSASSFVLMSVLGVTTVPADPGAELGGLSFSGSFDTFFFEDGFGNFSALADGSAFEILDVLPGLDGASDFELAAFASGLGSFTGGVGTGAQAELFLTVANATAFVLDLTYQFDYTLGASVSGAGGDVDAFADAYFELLVNGASDFLVFAELLLGDADSSQSAAFTRTFRLNPGDSLELALFTGASGYAAAVPLPASLPLLAAALGVLARVRRRKAVETVA